MNFDEVRNKRYFLPVIFVGFGALLVVVMLFTQLPSILQTSSSIEKKSSEVAKLQETFAYISSYSNTRLEEDVEIANAALPPEKDVGLVFSTLSRLARDSSVVLDSYSVSVGDVFELEGGSVEEDLSNTPAMMHVDVVVAAQSTRNIDEFLENLYLRLPLSSIDSVRIVDGDGRIALSFYYFEDRNMSFEENDIVTPLDENRRRVLNTIRGYSQN